MKKSVVLSALGIAAVAIADKMPPFDYDPRPYYADFVPECPNLAEELSFDECSHLRHIGFKAKPMNRFEENSYGVWISGNGKPNRFNFVNLSLFDVILVLWIEKDGDERTSFGNIRRPALVYPIRNGNEIFLTLRNNIKGTFSFIEPVFTKLNGYGQIANTWAKFNTGPNATINISRRLRMDGTPFRITVLDNGCNANKTACSIQCKDKVDLCKHDYDLMNCEDGSQPGATYGVHDGEPVGGCQGWDNGGIIDIRLGRDW